MINYQSPAKSSETTPLASFPGAEGYGAESIGGRGGTVYIVSNKNNSGTGSLREALEASGPRTVVFQTAGVITLDTTIIIDDPYITIAGQTAPKPGITLRLNQNTGRDALIRIATHDVIIRYMKFRRGDTLYDGDNISIQESTSSEPAKNIIIDHCSLSWGTDENIGIFTTEDTSEEAAVGIQKLTIQNSIIAEPLNQADDWVSPTDNGITLRSHGHPLGMLIGGKFSADSWKKVKDIDIHHNIFAHNTHRNPRIQARGVRVINNVIYNWFSRAGGSMFSSKVDYIGNYYQHGPMSSTTERVGSNKILTPRPYVLLHLTEYSDANDAEYYSDTVDGSLYLANNIAPVLDGFKKPDSNNWKLVRDQFFGSDDFDPALEAKLKRTTPLMGSEIPVTTTVPDADNRIGLVGGLGGAGAVKYLDCHGVFHDYYDYLDSRIVDRIIRVPISNFDDGTKQSIVGFESRAFSDPDRQYQTATAAGGYERFDSDSVVACADDDSDGLPNDWEMMYGSNIDANEDADGDGYTNIEEYINATNPYDGFEGIDEDGNYTIDNDEVLTSIVSSIKTHEAANELVLETNPNHMVLNKIVMLVDHNVDGTATGLDLLRGAIEAKSTGIYDSEKFTKIASLYNVSQAADILNLVETIDPENSGSISINSYSEIYTNALQSSDPALEVLTEYGQSLGYQTVILAIDGNSDGKISNKETIQAIYSNLIGELEYTNSYYEELLQSNMHYREYVDLVTLLRYSLNTYELNTRTDLLVAIMKSRETGIYDKNNWAAIGEAFDIDYELMLEDIEIADPNADGQTSNKEAFSFNKSIKKGQVNFPKNTWNEYTNFIGHDNSIFEIIDVDQDSDISDNEVILSYANRYVVHSMAYDDVTDEAIEEVLSTNSDYSELINLLQLTANSRWGINRTLLLKGILDSRAQSVYNKEHFETISKVYQISDYERILDNIEVLDPDGDGYITTEEYAHFISMKLAFPYNTMNAYIKKYAKHLK